MTQPQAAQMQLLQQIQQHIAQMQNRNLVLDFPMLSKEKAELLSKIYSPFGPKTQRHLSVHHYNMVCSVACWCAGY